MSIELVLPSSHLILCRPLLLLSPIPPGIRVFSNESVLHIRWPKYWSSALTSVLPMNIQDWFPLGWTDWISLQSKELSRHHSSKASVLQCSAFFIVQLSYSYMTAGKTIALTRRTFVGKVMSLLFNMFFNMWSRLVSSKQQASFNFTAAVTICSDFGAPKNKLCHCFPTYLLHRDGTRCCDLSSLNAEF